MEAMALLQGLLLGATLLWTPGPQNLFLIRQGIRFSHVLLIALIYFLTELTLISLGSLGLGTALSLLAYLQSAFALIACLLLAALGVWHYRRAWWAKGLEVSPAGRMSVARVAGMALALSLLNPVCLFDTLILVGGFASQYEDAKPRIWFTRGAISASFVWFSILACLAVRLAPLLQRPLMVRLLDLGTGTAALVVAVTLLTRWV